MKNSYKIEHIDPIGQGVSKADGLVTFIKKTLPEETVSAEIYSQKKGVQFARLTGIESASPDRIEPACVHFNSCNGCDFQHTTYEKELEFKAAALKRHLFKFPDVAITVHGAKRRLGYRNRLQLHYDRNKKLLGLMDEKLNIVPVPECLITDASVAYELRALYSENSWLRMLGKQPPKGHIEIYSKDKGQGHNVQVSINKPYADGGFTQVNQEMNEFLKSWVQKKAEEIVPPKSVIYDLFGGNGNLSAKFRNTTIVVDKYRRTPDPVAHQRFFSIDLYEKGALRTLIALKNQGVPRPNWIVFDPPRSGLKNLGEFLAEFKPEGFIFIACQATSFARDTQAALEHYELESIDLFDLFPSTQHFETVGVFTRRKDNA